jgi:hypothetical protein
MIALRLVRLIEKHSDDLARGLMTKLATRAELAEMGKVPPEEVRQRVHEIYRHLGDWLLDRTESEVARRYEEIGRRRARQGVPVSTLVAAIAAVKGQLWEFLRSEAAADTPVEIFGELELLERIDRFFDQATIHAVHGYERAAAERAA